MNLIISRYEAVRVVDVTSCEAVVVVVVVVVTTRTTRPTQAHRVQRQHTRNHLLSSRDPRIAGLKFRSHDY